MSRMSEIHMEITERLAEGDAPEDIVTYLMVAYAIDSDTAWHFVNDLVESNYNDIGGETDDGWALQSAGFGTDEDYGFYGDE